MFQYVLLKARENAKSFMPSFTHLLEQNPSVCWKCRSYCFASFRGVPLYFKNRIYPFSQAIILSLTGVSSNMLYNKAEILRQLMF